MTSQSPTERLQRTVGVFQQQQSAEVARDALLKAGFSNDQVFIQTQALDPNPPAQDTKAAESAGGGALVGTILGALVGLLLSLGAGNMKAVSPVAFINSGPFSWGAIFAGAGIGAIAGGLIAGLAGVNVPKSGVAADRDHLSHKYLLMFVGDKDELARAKELAQQ
ncbi:hypothetical protein H6F88_13420 [Oculatella sp. FACHB-28]|uniref:hypothetical protein n=1 Tax=Oculatella sp. FACHB-28 TaxID=2692845 RepID=UPI001687DD20|nr:hypothetical protein [Oculatella sp. FACHB-28]MBD2057002.1 hypothetical protein [Oculatella sp. FACHB-28]